MRAILSKIKENLRKLNLSNIIRLYNIGIFYEYTINIFIYIYVIIIFIITQIYIYKYIL